MGPCNLILQYAPAAVLQDTISSSNALLQSSVVIASNRAAQETPSIHPNVSCDQEQLWYLCLEGQHQHSPTSLFSVILAHI